MAIANRRRDILDPRNIPPLREPGGEFEADPAHDAARADFVKKRWHSQDDLLRGRDRMVEENIRMLLGQQWILWSELQQRYVDIAEYFKDDERRWRQLPVLNKLMHWWMLMHARMTENPPVVSFKPGPDDLDSMLAETMDAVYKYVWRSTMAGDAINLMFGWLIPCGRAHIITRIDPSAGDPMEFRGDAVLSLMGQDGQPTDTRRMARDIPFGPDGSPRAQLVEGEDGDIGVEITGDPHIERTGDLVCEVNSCLEVRGAWGPKPWHQKHWHMRRLHMTPEEAWIAYGIELKPDLHGPQAEDVGLVQRILRGTGIFGASDKSLSARPVDDSEASYVTIYEYWERPSRMPGTEIGEGQAGGRLCIVTGGDEVIRDGQRFAPFRHTSPIRCFDFVGLPGRPQGTSPQEMLNGPARTRNRLYGHVLNHSARMASPIQLIDTASGINEGDVTNAPGQQVYANFSNVQRDPITYASPPTMGRDIYQALGLLTQEIDELGNVAGSEGSPPTESASGELVKELRFQGDRFLGPTLRNAASVVGRMAEDWMVLLPIVWDEEKIIQIAGDDNVSRTIRVLPEMFKPNSVNVEPEIESMLPESRTERRRRVTEMWQSGVFGDPLSAGAINHFLDQARFPHLSNAVRPGGPDRTTAEQRVGALLRGAQAKPNELPIFEWYDFNIHIGVLERFMKSPEFLKQEPQVMQQFVAYREQLKFAQAFAAIKEQMRAMEVSQAMGATEMAALEPLENARAEQSLRREIAVVEGAERARGVGNPPGPPNRGTPRGAE